MFKLFSSEDLLLQAHFFFSSSSSFFFYLLFSSFSCFGKPGCHRLLEIFYTMRELLGSLDWTETWKYFGSWTIRISRDHSVSLSTIIIYREKFLHPPPSLTSSISDLSLILISPGPAQCSQLQLVNWWVTLRKSVSTVFFFFPPSSLKWPRKLLWAPVLSVLVFCFFWKDQCV